MTISTDLVYDVLRKHQPDHLLLRAARADAATGLLDIKRLGEMLSRIRGRIVHKPLEHVSPLAVPVMLEIGRETVYGEAADALLAEAADELVKEAMTVSFGWSQRRQLADRTAGSTRSTWPAAELVADPAGVALLAGRSACSSSPTCISKRARASRARRAAAALRHRGDAGAAVRG